MIVVVWLSLNPGKRSLHGRHVPQVCPTRLTWFDV